MIESALYRALSNTQYRFCIINMRNIMLEILAQITNKRSQDIESKGFTFGYDIPTQRLHPLIKPPLNETLLIAEIKRASPSAGHIGDILCAEALAGAYLNGGANAISVLCEERYFKGSLADLMCVKSAYPNACILRKDFIQHKEEIDISYRAGADMVLLIVAMFIHENNGFARFSAIYEECLRYGITPLIEVHTKEEIAFILPLKPTLIGINARNLRTFIIDIPAACALYDSIPKNTSVIFESGINSAFTAFMIGTIGFNGMLCGSYLVESVNPTAAIQSLKAAMENAKKHKNIFFRTLFHRFLSHKPAIKICGITYLQDALDIAEQCVNNEVDMLGFILVKHSPRYIESKRIKEISKALQTLYPHILRVGVVNDKASLEAAKALYEQGYLHAIQLHGLDSQNPKKFAHIQLQNATFCFYAVQNIESAADFTPHYEGAFCLIDSKSKEGGGSGKSVSLNVLRSLNERYLCIAGGINAQNIEALLSLQPAMLDINSGIEATVGRKDMAKLREILDKVRVYADSIKSSQ